MKIETLIRRDGEEHLVTIPPEAMEYYDLRVGDTIAFVPLRREPQYPMRAEVQTALDEVIENDQDALRYLAQ